jgi:formiminotetrahydrofolate cyclodeaminase
VERLRRIELANQNATRVPLDVAEKAIEALDLALTVARDGNPAAVSDAGVAGICALAAAEGAALNVRINLPGLTDAAVAHELSSRQEAVLARARDLAARVREAVDAALEVPQG